MNQVLNPFIEIFMVVYFDDILLHSQIEEEHIEDLKSILQVLREKKLYLNLENVSLLQTNYCFLGSLLAQKEFLLTRKK